MNIVREKSVFDDLEEGEEFTGAPVVSPEQRAAQVQRQVQKTAEMMPTAVKSPVVEKCDKCHGSGQFYGYTGRSLGACFKCKGTGKLTFASPKAERDHRRQKAAERAAAKADAYWAEFERQQPVAAAWIVEAAPTFGFAAEMMAAVRKFGHLTEKQLAACQGAVAKREAAKAARVERVANAPAITVERIAVAFQAAAASGLKWPKLRLAAFTFSPAGANSRNAGSIYVKDNSGLYLGKVIGGKFIASRECAPEQQAAVIEAAADPEKAAVAYGLMTGSCACCGRELTNQVSVKRGIGPVCAAKFGWGDPGEYDGEE